ncbi:membrane-associated protein, putative [Bodo saltans]|uniref:Membrane-associated protein, putative n=1 Tax=Bodo saltans TaxID=75058 RepID=A0A0S4JH82_BODSA|nr:membrane-associated protein, putative [Bodo saltans]|eukprot:CUG89591.1 membrane-associated protein, putative [Bodo saltans]
MRCRFRTPVVAAVVAAAALIWLRMRRRPTQRDTPRSAQPGAQTATPSVTARCPYADAELGGYVRLPVFIQSQGLPTGVSVAPVLAYPPRHAMIPLVLQDSIAELEGSLRVSQALLCCEDITTCAADGKHAEFSTISSDSNLIARAELFRKYVTTACPFLKQADGDNDEVVCVPLSQEVVGNVFSHVAASRTYCAFLGHLPDSSTIVSCVLILSSQFPADATVEAILGSVFWMAVVASVQMTPHIACTQATSLSGATSASGSAFGKGRVRVAAKSVRTGRVVTAAVSPCPNVAAMSIELDEVMEAETPTLVMTDGVDGVERRIALHAPEPVTPAGSPTRRDQHADVPSPTAPSPSSQSQVSSSLEASAMEAWSDADSKPLLLYTNDVVGVSFACVSGSSVQEVRFASRPSVIYTPPPTTSSSCIGDASALTAPPILSIERVRILPEEWEQASSTFSTEDFFELLHHNIIYCLTPWETQLRRPEISPTELSGYPTWVYHEDQNGIRCRTYVCLSLEMFGNGPRRLLRGSADSVGPSKVVELLLLRWEAAVDDWDSYLPQLRNFVDRLHIDFNSNA